MKICLLLMSLFTFCAARAQQPSAKINVITTDIENFWIAYDHIISSRDSAQKLEYLNQYFISKGTPGLKAMMEVRNYTTESYLDAIERYPSYWKSIRNSMFKAKDYSKEIAENISKLKSFYPALKPADIYFTVGAFKSGGTTMGNLILIGSEIAMADGQTVSKELESTFPGLISHLASNPVHNLVFNNVNEYIHTQQKTTVAKNLLGQCVLEGVAEFVAEKATGKSSVQAALSYGRMNDKQIKTVFSASMFNESNGFWLYSNLKNVFNIRDLGYYVGYAITEGYYTKSADKVKAIREMIELDYNNQDDLLNFVDQSGYFSGSVHEMAKQYEESRPVVLGVEPVEADQLVPASVKKLNIRFSEPMDKKHRNFELGPLGKEHLLVIKRFLGFSEDGTSMSLEVELETGKHYQIELGSGFKNRRGYSMKPYLIDFRTSGE